MVALDAARIRLAVESDLDACCAIWKAGIDDYQGRLNQPAMPDDLSGLLRLLDHFLTTDPDRFLVATEGDEVVGFASATVRGDLWFLGMLFVRPDRQAAGLGRALLDAARAGDLGAIRRWGTCTDSAQPISNALYARIGLVPRIPIWRMTGDVQDRGAFPGLPGGAAVEPFETIVDGSPDGHRRLAEIVNALDREVIGLEHPADHALLRRDDRRGFLLRAADGDPLGYGYASAVGRIGPIATIDPSLVAPMLGWLLANVPASGSRAVWLPAAAAEAFAAGIRAGLRLDGFPGLICWSSSDHPFERYVPISLALV